MEAGLREPADGRYSAARLCTAPMRCGLRFRLSPLVALLAAILLILILPPTVFLVDTSLHITRPDGSFGQFTLQYYQQLFTSPYFAASLWNTVVYAIGSAVVAIALGVMQALIVERTNTPGRGYAFLAAILSLGIPHVLYVVAWLLLLGRTGPVNELIGLHARRRRRGAGARRLFHVGHDPDRGRGLRAADLPADVGGAALDRRLVRGSRDDERRRAVAHVPRHHAAPGPARHPGAAAARRHPRRSSRSRFRPWSGSPATSPCSPPTSIRARRARARRATANPRPIRSACC